MYEHRKDPLIAGVEYWFRLLRHGALALGMMLASLGIGVVGFKLTSPLSWMDSFLDASMLLGGMGPVNCGRITSTAGKLFASFYALFCGVVFLFAMSVLIVPMVHRFLHKFHLQAHEETPRDNRQKHRHGDAP